jgi:hypothetical protein
MHYVLHRSHRMQNHKFGVMCPGALVVKYVLVPPEHENSVSKFRSSDAPECNMGPADPTGCKKHKFRVTCPDTLLVESVPFPIEHEKDYVDVSLPGRTT